MQIFTDRVAVVTGAASGIGRAIAERCAAEGMRVVLADVEEAALSRAARELADSGARVLAVPTDVAKAADVNALAEKTLQAFGGVHLLCNNAGVAAGGTSWESSLGDWEWVIGVNLWGVIHGLRAFVPIMLAQDGESHIVNTASIAGLLSSGTTAPYQTTKHAVVGLSEDLHQSLLERGAPIGVSVLCPAWVSTQIVDAWRNRPAGLGDPTALAADGAARVEATRQLVQSGIPPAQVADQVFAALRAGQLYILTHPEYNQYIRRRIETIVGA